MFKRQDNAQLCQVDLLGGLNILRVHLIEFSYSPHTHEEFLIALTEGGAALPCYRGSTHQHIPGKVLVLNPGEVHSGGPAQGAIWQYRAFYVPADILLRISQELTDGDSSLPQFSEDVVNDTHLAALLRQAHDAIEVPGSVLECESHLLEALASLICRHAANQAPVHSIGCEHQAVKRAREYLEAVPGENITLESLAREAGLSPFRLWRVFHHETGLTPHAYQTLVRVRLAKTLLGEGIPISQAAVEAGFYDQAHLTRHFKRIYGVTPGQYHY